MLLWFQDCLKILRLTNNSLKTDKQFFPHKNQSGIVLNKQPNFSSDDVKIPFVRGDQELYYLEEYVPEETTFLAMGAQRMIKLSTQSLFIFSCVISVRH